jgi:hypothetical protein
MEDIPWADTKKYTVKCTRLDEGEIDTKAKIAVLRLDCESGTYNDSRYQPEKNTDYKNYLVCNDNVVIFVPYDSKRKVVYCITNHQVISICVDTHSEKSIYKLNSAIGYFDQKLHIYNDCLYIAICDYMWSIELATGKETKFDACYVSPDYFYEDNFWGGQKLSMNVLLRCNAYPSHKKYYLHHWKILNIKGRTTREVCDYEIPGAILACAANEENIWVLVGTTFEWNMEIELKLCKINYKTGKYVFNESWYWDTKKGERPRFSTHTNMRYDSQTNSLVVLDYSSIYPDKKNIFRITTCLNVV